MKYVTLAVLLAMLVALSGCFEGVSRDIGNAFDSVGHMFVEAGSK